MYAKLFRWHTWRRNNRFGSSIFAWVPSQSPVKQIHVIHYEIESPVHLSPFICRNYGKLSLKFSLMYQRTMCLLPRCMKCESCDRMVTCIFYLLIIQTNNGIRRRPFEDRLTSDEISIHLESITHTFTKSNETLVERFQSESESASP